jgi:Ser/Thr protein kinase RdoA (MazF antagonist)
MMKLALMKRFFETLSPEWKSPLMDEIAAPWGCGEADVRFWRASANFVAYVNAPAGKFVLRFNHESERSAAGIAAELELVNQMIARGLHAARPLASLAGRLVESVPTAQGVFHAVWFERLEGQKLEFDTLDLAGFERWGRLVGQVHHAGQGLPVVGRPAWDDGLAAFRRDVAPQETLAWRELAAVEAALRALPTAADSYGLVHYDLELDNLVWEGDAAGVFDFDDCGSHWYAGDIAFALRDLFSDSAARVNFNDERLLAFLGGYRAMREISPAQLQRIPLFLRYHNLVNFARITRSLGEGPQAGEPGWLGDLRLRLASMLERSRQDFAAHPLESLV